MTIIHSKKRAPGPELSFFKFRFDDVKDNGNTIFIVISNYTLVGVSSIRNNYSISFAGKFSIFIGLFQNHKGVKFELSFKDII